MPTETVFSPGVMICFASLTLCLSAVAADKPGTVVPPPGPPTPRQEEIGKWPANPELPDPFKFSDGSRVKTKEDWTRRRAEIQKLVIDLEYGPLLPTPAEGVKAVEESAAPSSQPASETNASKRAMERHILLTTGREGKVAIHVILTVPAGTGPFPVIVKGDLCWGRVKPESVAAIVSRGYMLAEFDRTEVAPDKPGRKGGVWDIYPGYEGGAMSAWAWGFQRVVDYALTRKDVDPKRVIVTGHSRGGKAALLAGALDERVALTNPAGSGCGGGGCFRYVPPKTEDLERITRVFPHWFELNFHDFGDKVDRLPFDQHFVKALCAPRALLTTDGLGDQWANPQGAQVTYLAAKEVYDFLGVPDTIGLHYRPGKHEQNLIDFTALLDFADKTLGGKKVEKAFDQVQFTDLPKTFSWAAPRVE